MTEDSSFDIAGWTSDISGSASALMIAARSIWPSFVQVAGIVYVVLGYTNSDEVAKYVRNRIEDHDGWHDLPEMERKRVGEIFGEIDLGVDFSRPLSDDDPIEQSLDDLAELVRITWPLAATRAFPGRFFECLIAPADDNSGPMVIFTETGLGN